MAMNTKNPEIVSAGTSGAGYSSALWVTGQDLVNWNFIHSPDCRKFPACEAKTRE